MLTVQEARMVGKANELPAAKGVLMLEGLEIDVYVLNEREVYGRRDFKVVPVTGAREKWVSANKVQLV